MMHCPNIMVRLQLQAKKTDRVKAAEASIKVLLDNPTKETAAVIKETQAEYDGMYSDSYSSAVTSWSSFDHLLESFFRILGSSFNFNFFFQRYPQTLNFIIFCPRQPRIWGLRLILRKQDLTC